MNTYDTFTATMKTRYLLTALIENRFNVAKTCRLLNVNRNTFHVYIPRGRASQIELAYRLGLFTKQDDDIELR